MVVCSVLAPGRDKHAVVVEEEEEDPKEERSVVEEEVMNDEKFKVSTILPQSTLEDSSQKKHEFIGQLENPRNGRITEVFW